MILVRTGLIVGMLISGSWYAAVADRDAHHPHRPLARLPFRLGEWIGRDAAPFEDDIVAALGVDEYINRQYIASHGAPLALYLGYYASQRQGDTMHSPQNCLPGAGWQPIESGRLRVQFAGRDADVNRYVVQKGGDRQVVLYWYQGRGRITAGEYANKMWLMLDAARLQRSDGGLARVITPVVSDVSEATAYAAAFAATLLPVLSEHLP
jgi:EpsI family protein